MHVELDPFGGFHGFALLLGGILGFTKSESHSNSCTNKTIKESGK